MANSLSQLIANTVNYQNNPGLIITDVLDLLTNVSNGTIEIADASNPFVFGIEAAACIGSAFLSKNDTNTRQLYAVVAQTEEDLYKHMSDWDYINRFAIPSTATFTFLFDKIELLNRLVTDPTTGIKRLTIPRNTTVTVSGVVFSLQYPINIEQLQHGGLQIVFDVTETSPMQTLSTNVIAWETVTGVGGLDYIRFDVLLTQFDIVSQTQAISAAKKVSMQIGFTDQFYFARAWMQNTDGSWTEIITTHDQQVYDPTKPTVTLQLQGSVLYATLPQIYATTNNVGTKLRIDVYETKGPLIMDLASYDSSQFQATWLALDPTEVTAFVAPLNNFTNLTIWADDSIDAGQDALSFDDLRTRVINNATGPQVIPITNIQITTALDNIGYTTIRNVDNITDRTFLATRALPPPTNASLITAANSSIETLQSTISDLVQNSTVIDNTDTVTILPTTLYKLVNNVLGVVSSAELNSLLQMPSDQRAAAVNGTDYLYSPFYYVLDITGNEFVMRPYYLDNPLGVSKQFVSANDTTLLQVSTQSFQVVKTATGFQLNVTVTSSDAFKALLDNQIYVQLSYVPENEQDRAYITGVLSGMTQNTPSERMYTFDLSTNYSVDSNNYIQLTKFLMYTQDARLTGSNLTQDFDLVYATTQAMGSQYVRGEADKILGFDFIPSTAVAITHEIITVKFGDKLDTLWAQARSVAGEILYETYSVDVPAVYTEDVYAVDPTTGSTITFDSNGNVVTTILHHAGDPVLDSNGVAVIQHHAGDTILDPSTGAAIPAGPRLLSRNIDLMLVEGIYWFATDPVAVSYRSELVNTMLTWLTGDLASMQSKLLEKTNLYFYPQANMGNIDVMISSGLKTTIAAAQSLLVTLYCSSSVYSNNDLRTSIENTTIQTIASQLQTQTVSKSAIEAALRAVYGNDIIDVEVTGLGGSDQPVMTVVDPSTQLAIKKKLVAQADESLVVQEDITFSWVRHDTTTLTN